MKLKLVTLAMASLVTLNAHATAIDYQHEFKDSSNGEHNDSFKFSTLFEQGFGLSAEAHWAQHPNDKSEKVRSANGSAAVLRWSPAILMMLTRPFLWNLGFRWSRLPTTIAIALICAARQILPTISPYR